MLSRVSRRPCACRWTSSTSTRQTGTRRFFQFSRSSTRYTRPVRSGDSECPIFPQTRSRRCARWAWGPLDWPSRHPADMPPLSSPRRVSTLSPSWQPRTSSSRPPCTKATTRFSAGAPTPPSSRPCARTASRSTPTRRSRWACAQAGPRRSRRRPRGRCLWVVGELGKASRVKQGERA